MGERSSDHHGSWSVVAEPGLSFEELCVQVRHGTVRRTTASAVRAAGGRLTPTREPDRPPYHCDVDGLTAEEFDAILGPEQRNPVPARLRWRGTDE